MTKLSKYEKETIINWNEAEDAASIYTFNADLKRRLAEFSRKYPQLCWLERSALLGSRGKAHWRVEGSRPIGSRVKRLAQGELMPCVNSYWVLPDAEIRRFSGFAAAPLREKSTEIGGMEIETDTA